MTSARSQKIGRNDPCPCGSKKKFKQCHGCIHAVPTPRPGQLDERMRQITQKAACLAPHALHADCQGKIIASHTVSRSGSLGEIAKDSRVYSYKLNTQKIHQLKGGIAPQLVGWREASTFPGFCGHHDKNLFAPLEDQPFTGSQQQCFLLGFRSIAWEWYAKKRASNGNDFRAALATPKSPWIQALMAQFNHLGDLGLKDISTHKTTYDAVLAEQSWSDCHGLLVEFDEVFPIQCSAAWSPTVDVQGNVIQVLDDSPRAPETATIASFAADGKSYFLLSWLPDSAVVASKMADSIDALPKENLATVVAALLLLTSENCHLSPAWYDALPGKGRDWVNSLVYPMQVYKPPATKAATAGHINGIGVVSMRRF